jgi:hypothetical protein
MNLNSDGNILGTTIATSYHFNFFTSLLGRHTATASHLPKCIRITCGVIKTNINYIMIHIPLLVLVLERHTIITSHSESPSICITWGIIKTKTFNSFLEGSFVFERQFQ